MLIGVPKEIKDHEYRVSLTPAGVYALHERGHKVRVQAGAGSRAGFSDQSYQDAGATLSKQAAEIYACDMVIKVKELLPAEFKLPKPGQILFCYHHFAPDPELLQQMIASKVSCIAYETVTDAQGGLPLLAPMSQIAGRLSIQMGAWALQMANGGSGVLLSGVPGVPPAKVIIIGAGTVGTNAARIAMGFGADIVLFDININRLTYLEEIYKGQLKTCYSNTYNLTEHIAQADLVIGALLIPGKTSPKLITRAMLAKMRSGSVLVDVGIDQGGISETSHPTSHSDPIYTEESVIHYCVPNMPAACARTSTLALTQATLPYVLKLADKGLSNALKEDPGLKNGLQIHAGQITYQPLAEDVKKPYVAPDGVL